MQTRQKIRFAEIGIGFIIDTWKNERRKVEMSEKVITKNDEVCVESMYPKSMISGGYPSMEDGVKKLSGRYPYCESKSSVTVNNDALHYEKLIEQTESLDRNEQAAVIRAIETGILFDELRNRLESSERSLNDLHELLNR